MVGENYIESEIAKLVLADKIEKSGGFGKGRKSTLHGKVLHKRNKKNKIAKQSRKTNRRKK